jgi:hypothetical protein
MGEMYKLKTCTVCNKGKLIPTGNTLDDFKCDNPECRMHSQNKVVEKNLFENVKSSDDVDVTHYRDEDGD